MKICLLVSTIISSHVRYREHINSTPDAFNVFSLHPDVDERVSMKASNTPAMVLCMPDCKKRYQITIPISMKKVLLVDTLLPMRNNISNKTPAQAKYPRTYVFAVECCYHHATNIIDHSKGGEEYLQTRWHLLSQQTKYTSEKAMSVAIGIANP